MKASWQKVGAATGGYGDQSYPYVFMLVVGILLVCIGAVTRTYMNILISKSPPSHGRDMRSTELKYKRLISEQGATLGH